MVPSRRITTEFNVIKHNKMCGTLKKVYCIYIQIFTASHVMVVVTNVPYIYYIFNNKFFEFRKVFLLFANIENDNVCVCVCVCKINIKFETIIN